MSTKRSILLINQYFHPSDAATAVLLRELVEDLAESYHITVLCESSGASSSESDPYTVHRCSLPAWFPAERATQSALLRWLTSFLFMIRVVFYLGRAKRYSLVVLASEPPFIDMVAGLLCVVLRQPFIMLIQDLYPEFAIAVRLRPVCYFGRILASLHSFVARRAKKVITISEDHKDLLARRGVVKIEVIPNWSPSSVVTGKPAPMPKGEGVLSVQYAGNLGLACDLNALSQALADLENQGRLGDFRIVIRGDGIKRAQAEVLASRYPNVSFHARVAVSQVAHALGECHAHLILMPAGLRGCVYPSKVNTILASGRPVIGSVPIDSALASFIESRGVGYVSSAEDPSQLASCMMKCFRDVHENPTVVSEMGSRGWRYVSDEWSRRKATGRYLAVIEDVLHEL